MINKPIPLEQPASTQEAKEIEEGEEKAEEWIMIFSLEEEPALLRGTISNR